MNAEQKTFVTQDGVKLNYFCKGSGEPLIVIPGWSATAELFALNIDALSVDHTVYVLESRGHGRSEDPGRGYRISRLAADAHDFFVSLKVEKASWMGHSMGCSVLWSYIELFGQESIHKLVLIDEPPFLLANPRDTDREIRLYGGNHIDVWQIVNALSRDWEDGFKAFDRYFQSALYADATNVENARMAMAGMPTGVAKEFLSKLLMDHLTQDWRDVIPRIVVPVLLITGDHSHATTRESTQWMVNAMENCTWVSFKREEGGNHSMMINNPEKFNRVVTAFLHG